MSKLAWTVDDATRPRPGRLRLRLRTGWLWLVPALAAAATTGLIMLVLPADRTLHGLGDFALKVSPLLFAVLAIAGFPRGPAAALGLPVLGVIFYMGFIDSWSFIQVAHLADAEAGSTAQAQFSEYYRFATFVNAFTVLFALFTFRMGGASAAQVLKLGLSGSLVVISGLNDLTMWAIYPWPEGTRPAVFAWASHVGVFLGRTPALPDMLLFVAAHLCLVLLVLRLPFDRWLEAARKRLA